MCGSVLLGMPALASIIAAYAAKLLHLPESSNLLMAVGCVALMVGSNLLGIRATSWVNGVAFVTLLGLFGMVVGENSLYLERGFEALGELAAGGISLNPSNLWAICALLFWAYLGWENLSFGLEEFQEPQKNIPRVYWGSFLLVTLLYLLLALVSVGAELSGYSVKGPEGIALLVEDSVAERGLLFVMVLLLMANGNAWVFSISRLFYASGKEGSLFRGLGVLDSRGIPRRSLLFLFGAFSGVILLAPLLGLSISFRILLVSQNFVFLFGLSIIAFFRVERGWRRLIFGLGGAGSCLFLLSGFSWWILYPLGLMALGFAMYRYRKSSASGASEDSAF
jgi:amino acid transporter